jgi:mannose-1-phosphate guanylyltransferase
VSVDDPSAYGLVHCDVDDSVLAFVEKPAPDQIDTKLINAGVYILEREVLAMMEPAGTNMSIERDVFPALVGKGLFGFRAVGYWLDIGTPERYLDGTFDILEGNVRTNAGRRLQEAGSALVDGARVDGLVVAPALVGPGSVIAAGAIVGGRAVLGRDVTIGEGAHVESSVLLDGSSVGARSTVSSSIVGPRAQVGEDCQISGGAVLGEGVRIGPGNALEVGARIFPGVILSDGAIKS